MKASGKIQEIITIA